MGDVRAAAAIVQRDSTMPAVSAMVHAIRCCSWSVLAALALMFGAPAFALKPPNVTDGELALTPPYCPDTMGFKYGDAYFNTSPRAAGWVAQMGKGFWAVHHYCWALINFRRTMATLGPPEQRRGNLLGVMGDYQYVLDNVPPNFILLPEIYTKIGDLQVLLSNISAAFDAYGGCTNAQTRLLASVYAMGRRADQVRAKGGGQGAAQTWLAVRPRNPRAS